MARSSIREDNSHLAPERRRKKRSLDDENESFQSAPSKKLKIKPETKECVVCSVDLATAAFPEETHPDAEHGSGVCVSCWEIHLESEVGTQTWDQVRCVQCRATLSNELIQRLATTKIYNDWLDKACKAAMENDAEWQTCPSASCNYGGYLAEDSIFICLLCKASYCVKCDIPMHTGETCKVYQERMRAEEEQYQDQQQKRRAEKASEKEVKKISKVCPNCSANVQKRSGCDHMRCRCKFEFCYRCLVPYAGKDGIRKMGNRAHERSCRHHTSRLPRLSPELDTDTEDEEDRSFVRRVLGMDD